MARPRKNASVDEVIDNEQLDPVVPEAGDSEVSETTITEKKGKAKSYIIANPFVDRDNFSTAYNPGDPIPDSFDTQRIADLLKLGLIKEK